MNTTGWRANHVRAKQRWNCVQFGIYEGSLKGMRRPQSLTERQRTQPGNVETEHLLELWQLKIEAPSEVLRPPGNAHGSLRWEVQLLMPCLQAARQHGLACLVAEA